MRPSQSFYASLAVLALTVACGSGSNGTAAEGGDASEADGATEADAAAGAAHVALTDAEFELLKSPSDPALNQSAPAVFKVRFKTTQGDVVIESHRDWAPNGADRFYNLSKSGYFDGIKFFRVVKGFMAQFGIHGDPSVAKAWMNETIQDDPRGQSNKRGFVTYGTTGAPNSRATQMFINYGDNGFLDPQGFVPFGKVVEGMDVVGSLFSEYGEQTTSKQGSIMQEGNAFLDENYPKLDAIVTARVEE